MAHIRASLVPDYDDSDSDASDGISRLADVEETRSSGLRSRCDYEHSTVMMMEDRSDDGSECLKGDAGEENDERASRTSHSSLASPLYESAPKRRRQTPDMTDKYEMPAESSHSKLAGTAESKKLLGSRYAAHALFQRSLGKTEPRSEPVVVDSPAEMETATPSQDTTMSTGDSSMSSSSMPAIDGGAPPGQDYMAWWAATMAMWSMQHPYNTAPFAAHTSHQTQQQAPLRMDAAMADRLRLEKVSRRELGIGQYGEGEGVHSFVEMRGEEVRGEGRGGEGRGGERIGEAISSLRAAKSASMVGSLWDGDKGEMAAVGGRVAPRMTRKKHQINYLAMDAQARALQMAEMRSGGGKARALAHQKYGW